MLQTIVGQDYKNILELIGLLFAFFGTALITKGLFSFLPADQGREFAVDGTKSKGKPRGAGIVFVLVFVAASLLFATFTMENFIYLFLITMAMLTGYLDDVSKAPWGEYKKGFLDLLIAVLIAVAYLNYNGSDVHMAIFNVTFTLPKVVYGILAVILVWASINVTNCTDGVDGLSASVTVITLGTIYILHRILGTSEGFAYMLPLFIVVLLAYLLFNSSPSMLLMGDAGSRAMGLMIAIAVLKTGAPFLYLLVAAVLIADGGIGLVKVSLKRFLKISILTNTLTPLHDHVRKNKGWSDTQVVFRYMIIQIVISIVCIYLV